MSEQTQAYIAQLLAELQNRFSESPDRVPMMVLEDPRDSDCWIQFSPNALDVRYPFEENPESILHELAVPVPSSLELPEWTPNGHLAFNYDGSLVDDAARFIAAYADAVFERSPIGWTLEEDFFDDDPEKVSKPPEDEIIAEIARSSAADLLQPESPAEDEAPTAAPPKKQRTRLQRVVRRALMIGVLLYGGLFLLKGPGTFFSFYTPGQPDTRILAGEHCYLRHAEPPGLRRMKAAATAQSRDTVPLPEGSVVSPMARRNEWLQVETQDGLRGFIAPLGAKSTFAGIVGRLPRIDPDFFICTTYENMRAETLGKKLEDVEKRYGPASSILPNGRGKEAYFLHIDSTRKGERFKGMFLVLDANSTVVDIQPDAQVKYPRLAKLPLVSLLRNFEFFGVHYRPFYQGTHWLAQGLDALARKAKGSHWSLRFLVRLVQIAIGLLILLLVFLIPCLLAYPFILVILNAPRISNGLAILLIMAINAFCFYLFFLYREVPDGSWVPLAFLFIVFSFSTGLVIHTINYNRCPCCHLMGTAVGQGSTLVGETENISVSTYDVYKGRRESETEKIEMYERRRREKTETFDNFEDHRQCANCGYRWDVSREVKTSETTRET
jgi:hypothetical protein